MVRCQAVSKNPPKVPDAPVTIAVIMSAPAGSRDKPCVYFDKFTWKSCLGDSKGPSLSLFSDPIDYLMGKSNWFG